MIDIARRKLPGSATSVLILFALIAILAGCSKSADELYADGKAMILDELSFEDGVRTLQKFEKKFPQDPRTPEIILALAASYQSRNNYEEAAAAYERLLEKYPESPESYKGMFLLGYMYYEDTQDEAKAKTTLEKFISVYPDSELTVSAKVLLDNIGVPVQDWSIVRSLEKPNVSDQ